MELDDRTLKALGGALTSDDPNRFFSDVLKYSFAVLPLLKPGYLKEVPKQGFADGGHVLEDDYPTHYLPEVGRQVMADGGIPGQRFAAMDPSALVGTSPQPFRGGEAYTDAGGLEVSSPYVSGMSGGYPVFDLGDKPTPKTPDLPGGKNPFEDWLQFNWLSKLMGYADGGEVKAALDVAKEAAKKRPFDVLPLSEDDKGLHFDPEAGALGKIARAAKYFKETMTGETPMDVTSPEAIESAADLAGLVTLGSGFGVAPSGSLNAGIIRQNPRRGLTQLVEPLSREEIEALQMYVGDPEAYVKEYGSDNSFITDALDKSRLIEDKELYRGVHGVTPKEIKSFTPNQRWSAEALMELLHHPDQFIGKHVDLSPHEFSSTTTDQGVALDFARGAFREYADRPHGVFRIKTPEGSSALDLDQTQFGAKPGTIFSESEILLPNYRKSNLLKDYDPETKTFDVDFQKNNFAEGGVTDALEVVRKMAGTPA